MSTNALDCINLKFQLTYTNKDLPSFRVLRICQLALREINFNATGVYAFDIFARSQSVQECRLKSFNLLSSSFKFRLITTDRTISTEREHSDVKLMIFELSIRPPKWQSERLFTRYFDRIA